MAEVAAAAVGAAGSIGGSLISGNASAQASKAQAANQQEAMMLQQFNLMQQQQAFAPFTKAGTAAVNTLGGTGPTGVSSMASQFAPGSDFMNQVTAQWQPTMQQLQQTPGYQFTLDQGLQTVANAYSGQGLGAGTQQSLVPGQAGSTAPSGVGMKGALNYAQGLAANTYQQQFSNYMAQNAQRFNLASSGAANAFNMQMGTAQLGEQAQAAIGGISQNATNQMSGLQSGIGASQAAGIMGQGNALAGGLASASQAPMNYAMLNALNGGSSLFGGSDTSTMLGGSASSALGGSSDFIDNASLGMEMGA